MPGIPLAELKRQQLLQKYGVRAPVAPDLGSTDVPSGYFGSEGAIGSPVDSSQPPPPPQFTQAPLSMGPQNPQMMQGPPMPGVPPGQTPMTNAPMDMGPWNPANTQGPPMPENIQPAADTQNPQQPTQSEPWDPSQLMDPRYGTFFNKQRSADALLAIGAGLLKGRSFNEGLGNAADSLRQMDQQYEAPTPADVMRARIQMLGSASMYAMKPMGRYVTPAGRTITAFSNGLGQTVYQLPNGVRTSEPPPNLVDERDPSWRAKSQQNEKSLAADTNAAQTLGPQLNNIDEAWKTIPNSGNAGASGDAIRAAAKVLGVDVGNVNLGDTQIANKAISAIQGQTAKLYTNGGQVITDQLRSQVEDMIPKVGSDPRALGTILAINEVSTKNTVAAQKAWHDMPIEEKEKYAGGYLEFKSKLQDQLAGQMEQQVQDVIKKHAQSDPFWAKQFPDAAKSGDTSGSSTSTNVPWKVIK